MAASARPGERATSFAVACSLLSCFVRQNGNAIAELGLRIQAEAEEAERRKETMELFPQSTGFGVKDAAAPSSFSVS
ncbi:unnamed protein product [Miscanthus lutarioriparius]|uniref:Uncharacterized protein n=1 Tax=Miscanthus lutarioriparius TaxID=422564 RepID=A0A811MV25_9POAL|nr:unnamed protein product [Miscanthus lutarioriparius]